MKIRCEDCGKRKLSKYFPTLKRKRRHSCFRCRKERTILNTRKWRKNQGVDAYREYMRKKTFLYNLKRLYGITLDEYEDLRRIQGDRCAICGDIFIKQPHIDHCHRTGRVRGLLCSPCNLGIGSLHDSVRIMKAAIRYLKANGEDY